MYKEAILPSWRTPSCKAIRDGFGEGLAEVGRDERVVVLTGNLKGSTRVAGFANLYPDRFFDVGVAEQNLVGVAAGLALEGMIPIATSFAVFSPGRSWDQIRVSCAYARANVKIVGSHGGLAVGENGASHQALEDVAIMRVLPNMTVLTPADANQARGAVAAMVKHDGPTYLRLTRPNTPVFTKPSSFEIGKAYVYRDVPPEVAAMTKTVTMLAYGIQVWDCLKVSETLAREGIEAEVINVSTIKPLDEEVILGSARKTGRVVIVEDHQVAGGLGGVVTELLSEKLPTPVLRLGVQDTFGVSGNWQELYKKFGLDTESIHRQVAKYCHQ